MCFKNFTTRQSIFNLYIISFIAHKTSERGDGEKLKRCVYKKFIIYESIENRKNKTDSSLMDDAKGGRSERVFLIS